MARKPNFADIDSFVSEANMIVNTLPPVEPVAKKRGRRKSKTDNQTVMKAVYFDEKTSEVIDNYCDETGIAFSILVKMLLKEKGILK